MQELMLSVAVITYNQEDYIAQTLDSILSQEHDYMYEIIIGEDNSSDNTKKIIEEYVKKYPEIIKPIYNNPNKGLIKNYFNVIEHCQGKYIMECAGDDYWLPGKVVTQIKFMENNPDVGMCYSTAKTWNENLQKIERKLSGNDIQNFEDLLLTGNKVPAPTVCIRRVIVEEYIEEIKPQEKDWLMEDYPMWIWIARNYKMYFSNTPTVVYRKFENSASHNTDFEKTYRFMKNVDEIQRFFSCYYSVYFPKKTDEFIYFTICVQFLTIKYSQEFSKKLRYYYKRLENKNIKCCIFYIFSFSIITWYLFNILRKVKFLIK